MKGERSSRTAMMVAGMRAMADAGASHVRDFHDPTARLFLDEKWTQRLAKTQQQLRAKKRTGYLAYVTAASDMMALRTSTIDAAVRAAIASGTRQVVILG